MRLSRYFLIPACSWSWPGWPPARPHRPLRASSPLSQDLGERPQQPLELTYTVRNTGGSALRISRITTSCDCTKATMDRTEIPAGESAQLRVTLDPAEDNLYGNILRVVYLTHE